MNELALFAGAGGGILGGVLLDWRTVCAVELDPYAASVLLARQNDGVLPPCPIWGDVCTFDGRPWKGLVDVVSGGFPCQDISAAGKGAGIDGKRSGLWREMHRIIGEVRPRYAFLENSPLLVRRGLARVLGDLAAIGYDAAWCVLGADDVGAPHVRKRIWILACDADLADADGLRRQAYRITGRHGPEVPMLGGSRQDVPDAASVGWGKMEQQDGSRKKAAGPSSTALQCSFNAKGSGWWKSEPDVGRVAHGVAARVDRLRAIGNGQVPAVAASAFLYLSSVIHSRTG